VDYESTFQDLKAKAAGDNLPAKKEPRRAVVELLDSLSAMYLFDPDPRADGVFRAWEQALAEYSDTEIVGADRLVFRRHKYRKAPMPGEVVNWINEAQTLGSNRSAEDAQWKIAKRWINKGTDDRPVWQEFEYAYGHNGIRIGDLPGQAAKPGTTP